MYSGALSLSLSHTHTHTHTLSLSLSLSLSKSGKTLESDVMELRAQLRDTREAQQVPEEVSTSLATAAEVRLRQPDDERGAKRRKKGEEE